MAIDFPNSPSNNDQFTVGTTTWMYNGTAWVVSLGDASIATGAITADKIASNAVTTAKILDANITAAKIASDAVTTAKILDANVTAGKIASGAAVSNIGYTPANIASPTFTGTVVLPSTTSIGTVTATEIGYVDGVTSAIQTQLDSKLTATTATTSSRNVVINGDFKIWQRGGSSTGTAPYYTGADRWQGFRGAAASGATWYQITVGGVVAPANFAIRPQRNSGNTSTNTIVLAQSFETINVVPLRGKVLTLSFYARCGANYSPTSSILSATVAQGTGTDSNAAAGFTSQTNLLNSGVTLTTSYQRFTVTASAALASNIGQLAVSFYMDPTGTAGANDWFEVTGVQLEASTVATPFEVEDIGTTLQKCQRYYEKMGTSGTIGGLSVCYKIYGNHYFPNIFYSVAKRSTPLVYFTSDSGGSPRDGKVRLYGDNVLYSVSLTAYSTHIKWYVSGVANTNGLADWDYIEVDAEL